MAQMTKKMRLTFQKISIGKFYDVEKAIELIYSFPRAKFIENVDVAINLNINSKNSDQNIHNSIIFPYGIGKKKLLAVFADGLDKKIACDLGIELSGMEEIADKIKKDKKINIDHVIATPYAMSIVEKLAPILGPRGLMPNPKNGTITNNIKKTIEKIQKGQMNYRNDKYGIVHMTIGKVNFKPYKLKSNLLALLKSLLKHKPNQIKGVFIKKVSISTTMGVGILLNHNELLQINKD